MSTDPITPDGEVLTIEVRRSGVVQWQYEAAGLPEGWVILPFALLWNLIGRLAYRGGWTIRVLDQDGHKLLKHRHRSKDSAEIEKRQLTDKLRREGRRGLQR